MFIHLLHSFRVCFHLQSHLLRPFLSFKRGFVDPQTPQRTVIVTKGLLKGTLSHVLPPETTLETSGEHEKTTLETSGEDDLCSDVLSLNILITFFTLVSTIRPRSWTRMSDLEPEDSSHHLKTTLETSGEDVKTTLETSGEDVKTTLKTSGEDHLNS